MITCNWNAGRTIVCSFLLLLPSSVRILFSKPSLKCLQFLVTRKYKEFCFITKKTHKKHKRKNNINVWTVASIPQVWTVLNPLNACLNPICHLLALLWAHHIFHVSGLRVNFFVSDSLDSNAFLKYLNVRRFTCAYLIFLCTVDRTRLWNYFALLLRPERHY